MKMRLLVVAVMGTFGLTGAAYAVSPTNSVLHFTINGSEPLGYTAAAWHYSVPPNGAATVSTSEANLFTGSGSFDALASPSPSMLEWYRFIGLYGSFDGQNFTPAGVAYLATDTAAQDIISNNKTFANVFGESEQAFIDDMRTPISGLSFSGATRWDNAEGAHVPINTQGTLIYFSNPSGNPTSGGTGLVTASPVPEPVATSLFALAAVGLLTGRRSRPASIK
jgi:hypothetical protein